MKINFISQIEKRERKDALVIPFFKGKKGPKQALEVSGPGYVSLQKSIAPVISSGDFSAEKSDIRLVYIDTPYENRLFCLGLGNEEEVTLEVIRRAYAALVKQMTSLKVRSVTVVVPQLELISESEVASAAAEGLFLGNYRFLSHKKETVSEKGNATIESCTFVGEEPAVVKEAVQQVYTVTQAVYLARDLVNGNADEVTPDYLADVAKKMAKKGARLSCRVYDRKWIEKQGMGLFLAVSQGARHEPRFIVVNYKGNPNSKDHTVLVGKAVTFDTGGLNLKPTGGIEGQKGDMAGAAAVLGAMQAIQALSLPINVSCVIASCENAIGPNSYKPGDVFYSYLGKTVEVNNTDAEGRLTLADALAWAVKELKPSRIVDLATLTGSCIVALGHEVAGLFSNSDIVASELELSSKKTHERIWRLPVDDDYRDRLKSDIADMKNTSGREGGASLGAAFLRDFVANVPWAHLDIAGPAFLQEAKWYMPKHGTGFGVRLLVDFLKNLCQK